ncbi:hypothetical protein ALC57_18202 [Trachymyrmex cornetzi]|uniref:Uncharacterized protein n=1 Tax=Trachymyrmex cornetzi TaxID=471704 RepID=A0A195D9Y6_9HYME|nr:hypothetical protein ALC57_18202 [Trachymyrmex cornetzi]
MKLDEARIQRRAESSDRSYFPLRILEHCVRCVRLLAEPREHEVMHARLRLRPPPLPPPPLPLLPSSS